MNLISPPQYQALDRYLEAVAQYAQHLLVLDQFKRTPLADFSGWQQNRVDAAMSHMESEKAKLNAACGCDFTELFPDVMIGTLLSRKMGADYSA